MPWLDPPAVQAPAGFAPLQAMATGKLGQSAKPVSEDDPLPNASAPLTWSSPAAARRTVTIDATFQVLFDAGKAKHGGYVINTSPPGTGPIWVDLTGATGAAPGPGSVPVYPASSAGSPPGVWRFPGTTSAVTLAGPAGSTVNALGG